MEFMEVNISDQKSTTDNLFLTAKIYGEIKTHCMNNRQYMVSWG